ncbi:hypothetical protein HDU92_000097 [Lobulomyces angularis]|nr:hypothetical protein HDU92_000097 [Lobulomyces angularis]
MKFIIKYPYDDHTVPLSASEIFKFEGDDQEAASLDNDIKNELRFLLSQSNLSSNLSKEELNSDIIKENLIKFSKSLEIKLKKCSNFVGLRFVANLPFNIYSVLVGLHLNFSTVEEMLCENVKNYANEKISASNIEDSSNCKIPPSVPKENYPFPLLCEYLKNSDAAHNSLLKTIRELAAENSAPQVKNLLPATPVFDIKTDLVSPIFKSRALDEKESLHGRVRLELKKPTLLGTPSIVQSLSMFKRGLEIFSMDQLKGLPLGKESALLVGGSVTACLRPWPKHIIDLYREEEKWKKIFMYFPVPIDVALHICNYSIQYQEARRKTDQALFRLFHINPSPYSSSDLDLLFLSKNSSLQLIPSAMYRCLRHIKRNRLHYSVEKVVALDRITKAVGWGDSLRHLKRLSIDEPTIAYVQMKIPTGGTTEMTRKLAKNFIDEKVKSGNYDLYSIVVESRVDSLATVRTNNTVTMAGLYPLRHVQLLINAVEFPEQCILQFDLDCCAVYFDGENVYASDRAIRAFNTGTNFVDPRDLKDTARARRMAKYCQREFDNVFFEQCRHNPRCDVACSESMRAAVDKNFLNYSDEEEDESSDESDSEDYYHRNLRKVEPEDEPKLNYEEDEYTPVPLLYGPDVNTVGLESHLEALTAGDPIIKIFDTIDLLEENFINNVKTDDGRFKAVQFKWEKDSVLRKNFRFSEFFTKCYMCSADLSMNDGAKLKAEDGDLGEMEKDASQQVKKIPLCETCVKFNKNKVEQVVDLKNTFSLVTGGRTKIGYHSALRLLRNGSTVIVTTRFPLIAAKRFFQESDSKEWWNRLRIYGLDFRNINSVLEFADLLLRGSAEHKIPYLDILINNAAQTIRRPAAYHESLVKLELEISRCGSKQLFSVLKFLPTKHSAKVTMVENEFNTSFNSEKQLNEITQKLEVDITTDVIAESSLQSLVKVKGIDFDEENVLHDIAHFDCTNVTVQNDPLDNRTKTTWNSNLFETSISEVAEVTLINQISPTLLIKKLVTLMTFKHKSDVTATPMVDQPSFIINVTSMEGNFNHAKNEKDISEKEFLDVDGMGVHPHTNMCKAALNRLTQTMGGDLIKYGVYMSAVVRRIFS